MFAVLVSQPQIDLPFVQIYAATMVSATLSSLPPEILCQVFQSADDFSVVAALGQTARKFYNTWREHPTSICKAVAPRIFSNLADAELLVDMEEEAEASKQDSCDDRAIFRAKRLLFNARCASAAYDSWVSVCSIHTCDYDRGEDPEMRPSERARFEHAFYCVWTVGVMARATHLQEQASAFLDRCSPRELCRLDEMEMWVTNFNENEFGSLGLDLHDATWKAGCDLVSKRWRAYENGTGYHVLYPDFTPFGFFAFFDHTQDYLGYVPDHW